jgi:hypothetical protein
VLIVFKKCVNNFIASGLYFSNGIFVKCPYTYLYLYLRVKSLKNQLLYLVKF